MYFDPTSLGFTKKKIIKKPWGIVERGYGREINTSPPTHAYVVTLHSPLYM
jgi:hypothetical protein